jgi:polysaccharide deacetylase family protein (PEP-CTERM system associated)
MRETFATPEKTHILTVALEDYFHGPAFSKVISKKRWGHLETRFEHNCADVLDRLENASAHATFFVNAWIARKCPGVLREVIHRGHEIALAGQRGLSFRHLNRDSLREILRRDRDIIEQQTARKVLGFRVTDVLLQPQDLWALEELASLGFRYDSSVSPFLWKFHSEAWRRHVHKNELKAGDIWEVPLSSESVAGLLVPFAGGNYFRQYPEWLIERFLAAASQRGTNPLVLYFRLWDLDADQPRLQTGSLIRDFRHYRNGERMIRMMDDLLRRFQFTSISNYLDLPVPEAAAAPVVSSENYQPASQPAVSHARTPISVIVPCFNEAEGIAFLANNLAALRNELAAQFDTEFVLVDDGSSDETWSLLRKYFEDNPYAKLIRHERNQGVSAAIMTGLLHAREIACSIDCDCSYDPGELRPMLNLLVPGVDLVTASPYHPSGTVLNVPGWRLLLSRASSALYRIVTAHPLHTFTACVRVYRRSAAVGIPLRYTGFLGVAELLGKMALTNKTIVEHPATLEVRIFGQSKMRVLQTIAGHLRLLSQLCWMRFQIQMGGRSALLDSVTSQNGDSAVHFPVGEPIEVKVEKG